MDSVHSAASYYSVCIVLAGTIGQNALSRNNTSYSPVMLEVLRQSFYMRTAVRQMLPTTTRFGITPRHLLLATETDQVCHSLFTLSLSFHMDVECSV